MPEISLERVDEGADSPTLNVVFIHGLGGNPISYWCHEGGKDDGYFWLKGIAEEVPGTAVWTVGYPADKGAWGAGWPVAEAATAILDILMSSKAFRVTKDIPIVFICHSLGGIIAKKLVVNAHFARGQQPLKGQFLDRIVGIVFLATPHGGSALARIASWAHWFVSPTINDLTASNAGLLELSHLYRDRILNGEADIRHRCYYEGVGIWGAEVVTAYSADPGLPGVQPVKVLRDHVQIHKPINKQDVVYEGILAFLEDEVKRTVVPPVTPVLQLTPIPSDSRIITGNMIVLGGNEIKGTPFAFEVAATLVASCTGDIISFEAHLFREREVLQVPPGKALGDFTQEEVIALPTELVRDYASNRDPAKLGGAYGVFGLGHTTSPLTVSEPMIVVNGTDVLIRSDFQTLIEPFRLDAGRPVAARYARLCYPNGPDEVPGYYTERATIECKIGFLPQFDSSVQYFTWIFDYDEIGTLSLRPA